MDKAEIFSAITQKNALRKQAQLPLLDVRVEYERAVKEAKLAEYWAFVATKQEDIDRLHEEVAEVHDGKTFGSRIAASTLLRSRLESLMMTKYGMIKPSGSPRHPIRYGSEPKPEPE